MQPISVVIGIVELLFSLFSAWISKFDLNKRYVLVSIKSDTAAVAPLFCQLCFSSIHPIQLAEHAELLILAT